MQKKSKYRSLILGLLFTLMLSGLVIRLLWLQTVEASLLKERAMNQWEKNESIKPTRGMIVDRNGEELAREIYAYIIAANLNEVKNPRETAKKLAPVMEIPETVLYEKLTKKTHTVELKNGGNFKVSKEKRDQIMSLGLSGIYSIRTTGRSYVEETLAAHVLGFINVEGKAIGGVEEFYDDVLRGKQGKLRYRKDNRGVMISDPQQFVPPEDGDHLVLTLDRRIQQLTEDALDKGMNKYQPRHATAIVVDPQTGEVLAMANRPTYNPNQFAQTWKSGVNDRNIAVQNQYEPGSTFKIVTLAAAIEEGKFDAQALFTSGSIKVEDRIIRDWNHEGWGRITYREGVLQSSNVAFVHLGKRLGAEKLSAYIEKFGFGQLTERRGRPTGIDLPGEGSGIFFGAKKLHPSELATTSFGQGIAVTPIQQVMAVAAIANGGTLYQPYVVKEIRDSGSKQPRKVNKPKVVGKVVSEKTATQVRNLLYDTVRYGTGKGAAVKGYSVAGKTGTAQKPAEGGGYAAGRYFLSFIGFAPVEHPRVVVYVALDDPQVGGLTGGTAAAPIAGEIIEGAMQVLNVKSQ